MIKRKTTLKIVLCLSVFFFIHDNSFARLIKPEPVSLRTLLWKNHNQKHFNLEPPTFGLNFLNDNKIKNKDFMLLCGFEKFDNFFLRIDILERLFVQIINSGSEKNKEIKLIPEMLNLLGCNKESFKKLILKMNYKITEKNEEVFFKYFPKKKVRKFLDKKVSKENPFKILRNLNLS